MPPYYSPSTFLLPDNAPRARLIAGRSDRGEGGGGRGRGQGETQRGVGDKGTAENGAVHFSLSLSLSLPPLHESMVAIVGRFSA